MAQGVCWAGANEDDVVAISNAVKKIFNYKKYVIKWNGIVRYRFVGASNAILNEFDKKKIQYEELTGVRFEIWHEGDSASPNIIVFLGDAKSVMMNNVNQRMIEGKDLQPASLTYEEFVKKMEGNLFYQSAKAGRSGYYTDMYFLWTPEMNVWSLSRQMNFLFMSTLLGACAPLEVCGSVFSWQCDYDGTLFDDGLLQAYYNTEIHPKSKIENVIPKIVAEMIAIFSR
ncbi:MULTISPECIES: hypothetical protein [unclassified Maridesulfovibrio]|uniref:hypothetical protein n=1 Tax=unclassified Maridesulfovibrio TaxID=2794999 RepID=UPI003B3E100F